jgi:predicted nucleic acid-binding Zn ribbon protein
MVLIDVECDRCGETREVELELVFNGDEGSCDCGGRLRRVWSPVAIGRVRGAGDSPARGSK